MTGFETIGNATIIVHDKLPVLATDPWICGEPYFGSWGPAYEIPPTQLENIKKCKYIWFSHGHPDHLIADSLDKLADKVVLLPNHVGGRINSELMERGLNTLVLPDAKWFPISENARIMCLPDYNQDATLLIAIKNNLIVNFNDSTGRGYTRFIKKITRDPFFKRRYILALKNYGDANMINVYDEDGNFLPPPGARKPSIGKLYEGLLREYNGTHTLPFSCFHQYQREDSIWAKEYETPLEDHFKGFTITDGELLPAFVSVDLEKDVITEINPNALPRNVKSPEEFGDNWSDCLEQKEFALCRDYFTRKEHLKRYLGFINLRVGGKDNFISLDPKKKTGITFECPRKSLMTSIQYQIFDDLLIGNFMKTILHGVKSLYPDFTPYVTKYGDNGKAESEKELGEYFRCYQKKMPVDFILNRIQHRSEAVFRRMFSPQSEVFQLGKKVYQFLR